MHNGLDLDSNQDSERLLCLMTDPQQVQLSLANNNMSGRAELVRKGLALRAIPELQEMLSDQGPGAAALGLQSRTRNAVGETARAVQGSEECFPTAHSVNQQINPQTIICPLQITCT